MHMTLLKIGTTAPSLRPRTHNITLSVSFQKTGLIRYYSHGVHGYRDVIYTPSWFVSLAIVK